MTLRITGRSSSHFTRVARLFAHACAVPYEFQPVPNLLSQTSADYAGNPTLKLPILSTTDGTWFGALNICRELARHAPRPLAIAWPEDVRARLAANAQEMVLDGMAAEVSIVMQGLADPSHNSSYIEKTRASLSGNLAWLEAHWPEVLGALPPDRQLSFLEVSAFCFIAHLDFRRLADVADYPNLSAFRRAYAEQPAASATDYKYDAQ